MIEEKEEIVDIGGIPYKISYIGVLTLQQKQSVIDQIKSSEIRNNITGTNSDTTNITSLAATCPTTMYWAGKAVTLTAKGSGGTPPYVVSIYRGIVGQAGNVKIAEVPSAAENQVVTGIYTLLNTDSPTVPFFAAVTDSCGAPKSDIQTCTLNVSVCPTPVCTFTVT